MTLWFQSILVVALLLLCIFLFLLFRQIHRTAVAIQHLAESAKKDLQQVAFDIHSLSVRTDKLLDLATDNLELPSNVSSLLSKVIQIAHVFLDKKTPSWSELIFTNIKFVNKLIGKSKNIVDFREKL